MQPCRCSRDRYVTVNTNVDLELGNVILEDETEDEYVQLSITWKSCFQFLAIPFISRGGARISLKWGQSLIKQFSAFITFDCNFFLEFSAGAIMVKFCKNLLKSLFSLY